MFFARKCFSDFSFIKLNFLFLGFLNKNKKSIKQHWIVSVSVSVCCVFECSCEYVCVCLCACVCLSTCLSPSSSAPSVSVFLSVWLAGFLSHKATKHTLKKIIFPPTILLHSNCDHLLNNFEQKQQDCVQNSLQEQKALIPSWHSIRVFIHSMGKISSCGCDLFVRIQETRTSNPNKQPKWVKTPFSDEVTCHASQHTTFLNKSRSNPTKFKIMFIIWDKFPLQPIKLFTLTQKIPPHYAWRHMLSQTPNKTTILNHWPEKNYILSQSYWKSCADTLDQVLFIVCCLPKTKPHSKISNFAVLNFKHFKLKKECCNLFTSHLMHYFWPRTQDRDCWTTFLYT